MGTLCVVGIGTVSAHAPTICDKGNPMPEGKYAEMKLDELQAELERRELPKSGNKPELIERLEANDTEQGSQTAQPPSQAVGPQDQSQPNPQDSQDPQEAAQAQESNADQAVARGAGDPGTQTGDPTDMSGNVPANAQAEALRSNVDIASEGQKRQADQTINKDPEINPADDLTPDEPRSTSRRSGDSTSEDPASLVENGGIVRNSERSAGHAQLLQDLSDERRKQQLAQVEENVEQRVSES